MDLLQQISYSHANKEQLFENINLAVNQGDKIALVGNNGSGKSTLLKIIAGILQPSSGHVSTALKPYYIPQHFGQYIELTIAEALHVSDKLSALRAILDGDVSETNLSLLDDDWTIEDRCLQSLQYWNLPDIDLIRELKTLSGGQTTKVFLAGISIHQPAIVLMDEPSNHLDTGGRELLYHVIESSQATMIIVSHDRKLLELPDSVLELSARGLASYGGNYNFYKAQKKIEDHALGQEVKNKEKELRKAKEAARETAEKQQRLNARGKNKQEKAGLPTISMNTFRNNAEKNTARLKDVHAEKQGSIAMDLEKLRSALPQKDTMKFGFDNTRLHRGKILIKLNDVNYAFDNHLLWQQPLNIQITSGERIVLKGANGSGKTTLLKIMLGSLQSTNGEIYRADNRAVYIEQDYSLINNQLSVYEQAQQFNDSAMEEHWIKTCLDRFLFTKDDWSKLCGVLSGGERMRLMLCCLSISITAPDIIVLDEPTNNLDIQNTEILAAAIADYQGTLIVVSHDQTFLDEVGITSTIDL